MTLPNDYTITKVLVSLSLEKTLREINDDVFEKVTALLKKKYNCYLYDTYDHPEYLNQILKDLYGDAFVTITNKIKKNLQKHSKRKKVDEFIKVVCNK